MKRLERARVRWYRSRFGFGTSRARNKHFWFSAESRSVRSADHRRVNESTIPRLSRKTKTIRLALASNEKAFRALDAKLLLFAMAKP